MTNRRRSTDIAELRGPINGLIVDYMRQHEIATLREFSDSVGVSRQTIYDLVRGRTTSSGAWVTPSTDTLMKLASVLGKPTHELLYLINPEAPGASTPLAADVTQVPVAIAGNAGAGPHQHYELDGYTFVEAEFARKRDLIAFRITGDSMAGGRHPIYPNDLVIVDRNLEPSPSNVVIARLRGDGYVCKRLRPGNNLDSANPEYDSENAFIPPERVAEVVGRVVRIIHTAVDI